MLFQQNQGDDVTHSHYDIVRNDFDAIRGESLSETGLFEVIVYFIECLRLIMAKDNREHDFAGCVRILRVSRHGEK